MDLHFDRMNHCELSNQLCLHVCDRVSIHTDQLNALFIKSPHADARGFREVDWNRDRKVFMHPVRISRS